MFKLSQLINSSFLISIAFILSKIKLSYMFFGGGSITLCSLVPIIIISFKYGSKIGMISGFFLGFFHLLTSNLKFQGFNIYSVIISILFDYIIANIIIGSASFFYDRYSKKNKIILSKIILIINITFVFIFKFIIHTLSGIIIWFPILNQSLISVISYSIFYNLSYNLPEMFINLSGFLMIEKMIPKIINNKI